MALQYSKEMYSDYMLKAVANIGTAIRALEDYNKNKIKNMKGLSAYHVQQAVELILKYLIYTNNFYNDNELYTHDISKLIMIAEGLNIGIPKYIKDNARVFTSWEAKGRYDLRPAIRTDKVANSIKNVMKWIVKINPRYKVKLKKFTKPIQ